MKRLSDILINGHFTRRPGDLIARYFGEEFVVILYGTPEKYAVKISESICHTVKDMQIPHAGTKVAGSSVVTVSLGVATETPDMGSTPQEMFVKVKKRCMRPRRTDVTQLRFLKDKVGLLKSRMEPVGNYS